MNRTANNRHAAAIDIVHTVDIVNIPRLGLFYSTEKTGTPDWDASAEPDQQPHLVQLAAELVDLDTRQVVDSMDVLVKPDGWTVTDALAERAELHGTTHARALALGIPEKKAIDMLLALHAKALVRITHNRPQDAQIIHLGLQRDHDVANRSSHASDQWRESEEVCTSHSARQTLGLHALPTLLEAYDALIGGIFDGAHSARGDTRACKAVYFAVIDKEAA